jgi:hypothetical protein
MPTCGVANLSRAALRCSCKDSSRFATLDVANFWRAVGVREVKRPEVTQVRGRVAPSNSFSKLSREQVEELVSVLGPDSAGLVVLDIAKSEANIRLHRYGKLSFTELRTGDITIDLKVGIWTSLIAEEAATRDPELRTKFAHGFTKGLGRYGLHWY